MPELGVVGWIIVVIAIIVCAPFLAVAALPIVALVVAFIFFKWIFRF